MGSDCFSVHFLFYFCKNCVLGMLCVKPLERSSPPRNVGLLLNVLVCLELLVIKRKTVPPKNARCTHHKHFIRGLTKGQHSTLNSIEIIGADFTATQGGTQEPAV